MNLAGVIASLATGTYTVTRRASGAYANDQSNALPAPLVFGYDEDGHYYPGAASTFLIAALIQPLSGRDLMRLPEGERTGARITIFTVTQLIPGAAPEGSPADTISYQGATYQVESVEPWNEAGNFYKAIARKVGQ